MNQCELLERYVKIYQRPSSCFAECGKPTDRVSGLHLSVYIDEKGTLKAIQHDNYENIAGSVWLRLFMDSNEIAYYYPRRIAPGWAQLNIYANKQYNFDPS
jgi:hypothetical protein